MVWLSCEGETEADKEWLGGVTYTPWQVTQPHFLQLVFALLIKLNNSPFNFLNISQIATLHGKQHTTMQGFPGFYYPYHAQVLQYHTLED